MDFFCQSFAYSDLKYIFAVRKGGAIAIGTIPGAEENQIMLE
jgi:hypothetical protein